MKAPLEEGALEVNLGPVAWPEDVQGPADEDQGHVSEAEDTGHEAAVGIASLAPSDAEAQGHEDAAELVDDPTRFEPAQAEGDASPESSDDDSGAGSAPDPRVWTSTLVYDERTGNTDGDDAPFRDD